MKTIYAYPGSFCPPTYGHLAILKKAASIFEEVIVICSKNPDKNQNWFSPEKCQELWLAYELPTNVKVTTIDKFINEKEVDSQIVMIRGIRDDNDFEHEKKVLFLNYEKFGIDQFFYIVASEEHRDISSSKIRDLAQNLELNQLAKYVAPLVISALLEQVLEAENIFVVVGRPGSGKSTFLKILEQAKPNCVHINTDIFSESFKPILEQVFAGEDLVKVALNKPDELKAVIGHKWLELIKENLRQVPKGKNLFIEVAYGLMPDKNIFNYLGGKIIYLGCSNEEKGKQRIIDRGTPHLVDFFQQIPGLEESRAICLKHQLTLIALETDLPISELKNYTARFG